MLEEYAPRMSSAIKVLCDGGYTGDNFSRAVKTVTVPPAEPGACFYEPLKAVKRLEPLKRLHK